AEVAERAIGKRADQLLSLDLNLTGLDVDDVEMEAAVDQIAVHLNKLKGQEASLDLVKRLMGQVSGELEIEFQTLYQLIVERDIAIDRPLVDRIEERFAPIRSQVIDRIERLRLLIPPERPSAPNPEGDWAMSHWLRWAVEEYLPFRFWLEETETRDEKAESFAAGYADWLRAHYDALLPSFPHIVYRALHNEEQVEHLMGPQPVLFIAIDNFNYKFLEHLERFFEEAGFYASTTTPYLSMLPTCTEVSKKCLFTGSHSPFERTAYGRPILDTWSANLKDRTLAYVPHLGALKEVAAQRPDVAFLNHVLIDDTLHRSEVELGVPHAKEVRRRLSDLVGAVKDFARRIDAERDLVVIICSDHGSTRIPTDAPNIIDQPFYTARLDNPHHRYIGLSDEEMERLPDNVDVECYRLRRGVFDLNENYLVARGYGRFKRTDEAVYVHGGLTPEETIVPLCVFQPVVEEAKDLTVRLLDDEFRYGAKGTVQLELVNVNPYPCLDLRLEILDENVDYEPVELENLPSHRNVQMDIPVRIWRRDEEVTDLRLRISYQLLGERRRQVEVLPITMRSMMESGFDLEELD
ncbi:MAG: PglZ domain-containing protein, partial [Chloroflexota bacterium]|nr:PglZ domain-containing protein [Chloroflexota bacterium]